MKPSNKSLTSKALADKNLKKDDIKNSMKIPLTYQIGSDKMITD